MFAKKTITVQRQFWAFVGIGLGIGLGLFGCKPQQKSALPLSKRVGNLIKIDGKLDEWQTEFRVSPSLPNMRYQIVPGEQHLYICVRTSSHEAQTQIIRLGMGVWVDTTMKQRNLMGIKFPLALTTEQESVLAARAKTARLEVVYPEVCQEFDIVGFSPEPLRATNTGSQNFKAAVGFDELGEMICEYQMPWKAIFQDKTIGWNEQLQIGIKINEPPKNQQDDDSNYTSPMGNSGLGQTGGNPMTGPGGLANQDPLNPNRTIARPAASKLPPAMWLRIQLMP